MKLRKPKTHKGNWQAENAKYRDLGADNAEAIRPHTRRCNYSAEAYAGECPFVMR